MCEYNIEVYCDSGKIIARISGENLDAEYAFYLKKNDVRIDTVWYSPKSSCEFIVEKGIYQIVGFIKTSSENIIILESEYVHVDMPDGNNSVINLSDNTVSIFGSCVSRDLLEYEKSRNFSLKKYFSRCSVISAISTPINVDEQDIALDSSFQRRMVAADLDKRIWNELKDDKADYLLVDFIDERFRLGKHKESIFTLSNEMCQSNYIKDFEEINREENEGIFCIESIDIKQYVYEFWDRILEIYSEDRIILHKAKLSDYYYDENGKVFKFAPNYLSHNRKSNKLLDYMYDCTLEKLKKCIVISVEQACYASNSHKWGLSPCHYIDEYYYLVLEEISRQINRTV